MHQLVIKTFDTNTYCSVGSQAMPACPSAVRGRLQVKCSVGKWNKVKWWQMECFDLQQRSEVEILFWIGQRFLSLNASSTIIHTASLKRPCSRHGRTDATNTLGIHQTFHWALLPPFGFTQQSKCTTHICSLNSRHFTHKTSLTTCIYTLSLSTLPVIYYQFQHR